MISRMIDTLIKVTPYPQSVVHKPRKRLLLVHCGLAITLLTATSCSNLPTSTPASIPTNPQKPVIALVLGGGGAKGFAHVGVIKVLEANGIRPDLIVGSSAGSLVGSLYASGKTPAELEHLALTTQETDLLEFTISHQGIIEADKLKDFVNMQVGGRTIEELPIRLAIVATEKHSQKKTVFTQGNTGLTVQASSSVPNLFIAPRIPEKVGQKYIDGGVSSIVPVDSARDLGADIVIAVDILPANTQTKPTSPQTNSSNNAWAMIDQKYQTLAQNHTQQNTANRSYKATEVQRADVVITPNIGQFSVFDSTQRSQLIHAGEEAAQQNLDHIKQAIANATPSHSSQQK
ncbi:patatin-like phospholipase family protein [Psychrobacter sp. I-STPA6b]|uniref:patatin-like phospholipase family protein n=1 Tax=Psychrobacter sp. I-STPA6b TaxID=2585718 RepID=UPI001D0CBCE0|nr:patatin-like phospholipase family protein [Psychrobacter sp. I-STPA6b]